MSILATSLEKPGEWHWPWLFQYLRWEGLFYVINNLDDCLSSLYKAGQSKSVLKAVFTNSILFYIVSQMLQYETEGLARITAMDCTVFRFLSLRQSYLVLFNLIFPFSLGKSALFRCGVSLCVFA